jgi:hypothetical protein
MKTILLFCSLTFLSLMTKAQSSIAAARASTINSTVVIKGVVINGAEMGTIRYVQDNMAGISAFSSTLSSLNRGDSVQISGVLTEYKNLLEISTTTSNPTPITFTTMGTGITQTPSVITTAQFNENVEGRLIKFTGCSFAATGTFSSGINYTVNTSAGQFVARVTSSVSNLFGSAIPTGTVDIVGIGSQFCSSPATGCTTGYQLALRDINDITPASIGINEVSKEVSTINVFPNPASTSMAIKLENNQHIKSVNINDISGRSVLSTTENSAILDVSSLQNGIYTIVVITNEKTSQGKFVIEK